ncbi:hypothetical protein U1Q18_008743 [Sarracenia purpurea var. burkii]
MTNHRKVAEQGMQCKGYGEVICVVRNMGRGRCKGFAKNRGRGETGLGFCKREKFGFQRDHLLRDGVPSPEVTSDGIDGEHLMESMARAWIFRGDRKGGFQSCEWVFHQSVEG